MQSRRSMHMWLIGLAALLVETAPPMASELPLSLQIPAFLKALDFDRDLTISDSTLVIGVVFDPSDRASVESKDKVLAIQGQLTRLLVRGKRVVLEELAYAPGRPDLVTGVLLTTYLEASTVEELSQYAQSAGIVTLAIDPADVERGMVLGVESFEGKPRFVVNLSAAKASGVSFEARFLSLCRVVE